MSVIKKYKSKKCKSKKCKSKKYKSKKLCKFKKYKSNLKTRKNLKGGDLTIETRILNKFILDYIFNSNSCNLLDGHDVYYNDKFNCPLRKTASSGKSQLVIKCDRINKQNCNNIDNCKDIILKGPPKLYNFDIHDSERGNVTNTISIDPYTMNLLFQIITTEAVKNNFDNFTSNSIEHFIRVCKNTNEDIRKDTPYFLMSQLAGIYIDNEGIISDKGNFYVSLSDYILGEGEIINKEFDENKKTILTNNMIKNIMNSIISMNTTLDKLFECFQFHHCDAKAAQLLLYSNNGVMTAMIADLDKITFTLNINNKPIRIRLAKSTFNPILQKGIALAVNIQKGAQLAERMRYENRPRKTNEYEKLCFLSSILMLCPQDIIPELINNLQLYFQDKTNININSNKIIYNSNDEGYLINIKGITNYNDISDVKRRDRLTPVLKSVIITKNVPYENILKSDAYIYDDKIILHR